MSSIFSDSNPRLLLEKSSRTEFLQNEAYPTILMEFGSMTDLFTIRGFDYGIGEEGLVICFQGDVTLIGGPSLSICHFHTNPLIHAREPDKSAWHKSFLVLDTPFAAPFS